MSSTNPIGKTTAASMQHSKMALLFSFELNSTEDTTTVEVAVASNWHQLKSLCFCVLCCDIVYKLWTSWAEEQSIWAVAPLTLAFKTAEVDYYGVATLARTDQLTHDESLSPAQIICYCLVLFNITLSIIYLSVDL